LKRAALLVAAALAAATVLWVVGTQTASATSSATAVTVPVTRVGSASLTPGSASTDPATDLTEIEVYSAPLADSQWASGVAQVYFHPLWDDGSAHDLAVLRLADNHSAGVPPIQVGAPWNPELYAAGSAATIMGIGPPNLGFLAAADTRIDNAAYMQALYSSWNSDLPRC